MVAQLDNESRPYMDQTQKTKTLIYALNLISRNLPLPPDIFDIVSSLYSSGDGDNRDEDGGGCDGDGGGADRNTVEVDYNCLSEEDSSRTGISDRGDLISDLEDALLKQRPNCMLGLGLRESKENRLQSHIQHRLTELEV